MQWKKLYRPGSKPANIDIEYELCFIMFKVVEDLYCISITLLYQTVHHCDLHLIISLT